MSITIRLADDRGTYVLGDTYGLVGVVATRPVSVQFVLSNESQSFSIDIPLDDAVRLQNSLTKAIIKCLSTKTHG